MKFKPGERVIFKDYDGKASLGIIVEGLSHYYWVGADQGVYQRFIHESNLRLDDPFEQFVRETRFAAGLDKE